MPFSYAEAKGKWDEKTMKVSRAQLLPVGKISLKKAINCGGITYCITTPRKKEERPARFKSVDPTTRGHEIDELLLDMCRRPMANGPSLRLITEYRSERMFAVHRELVRGNLVPNVHT